MEEQDVSSLMSSATRRTKPRFAPRASRDGLRPVFVDGRQAPQLPPDARLARLVRGAQIRRRFWRAEQPHQPAAAQDHPRDREPQQPLQPARASLDKNAPLIKIDLQGGAHG